MIDFDRSINQTKDFLGGLSSVITVRYTGDRHLMSSIWSGKDFLNRRVLKRRRNVTNDSTDVTSSGRSFQICGPATGKQSTVAVRRFVVVEKAREHTLLVSNIWVS